MNIAYLVDLNNPYTYAGITVAKGFENAFLKREYNFEYFDLKKIRQQFFFKSEIKRLIDYEASIIFASVDDILHLDLKQMNPTKFVLWGAFFNPCDYEGQAQSIKQKTKHLLSKFRDRHQFLIWSQHSWEIIEVFFKGYEKELGLQLIQLLHCADETKFQTPIHSPEIDFLWIGNVAHRKDAYEKYMVPLKDLTKNYLEFNEYAKIDPLEVEQRGMYRNAWISPNIHTSAQIKFNMGLNERVFTSSLMGSFQICDNPLAREFFNENELIILKKPEEFLEAFIFYKKHPELRINMISLMQSKILAGHTYTHRIDEIVKSLS